MLLFLVKFTHTLVVISLLLCLYILWKFALHGVFRRWWRLALSIIVLEALVWIGYGWRCPLTDWAIALGDDTGGDYLTEFILVSPSNFVASYAVFAGVGITLALRRMYRERQIQR